MPTIVEQVQRFVDNEPRLHTIVNGNDNTSVALADGTLLPSLKKLFKSITTTPPGGWLDAFANSPLKGAKGDAGGNVMAIGTFLQASGINIPLGTNMVQTSGHSDEGKGAARYRATTNTGSNAARFQSNNGRWFELAEPNVDAYMFGATGIGNPVMLSDRFTTLAAARVVYPKAQSMAETIDTNAIQFALDNYSVVWLPIGYFVLSNTLKINSSQTFKGVSREASVLYNQTFILNAPMIQNADPAAWVYGTLANMTILGGTMALRINATTEVAGLTIENLTTNLQSQKSIEASSIQTTALRNLLLLGGRDYGIDVLGYPCNAITFDHVRVGDVRRYPIKFRGYDLVTFCNSCSIEQGAIKPLYCTVQITNFSMNVTAIAGGPANIEIGMIVEGPGIAPGTFITADNNSNAGYTGGGGGGTYGVNIEQVTGGIGNVIISYASIHATSGGVMANGLSMREIYFEGGHKILAYLQGGVGTTFGGNKCTNTIDSTGPVFAGDTLITFLANVWATPAKGPRVPRIVLGSNINLDSDLVAFAPQPINGGSNTGIQSVNTGNYRRTANSVEVKMTCQIMGAGSGFIKIQLPVAPSEQVGLTAINSTKMKALYAIANPGDGMAYIYDNGGYPVVAGDTMIISGRYPI
jgi:hypothetical protein